MKRRSIIKSLGLGSLLPMGFSFSASAKKPEKPSLRIAHLTDIHLYDAPKATRNLTHCLHHLQQLQNPVDVVLNGGDCIMDALGVAEKAKVDSQWDAWQRVYSGECSLEMVYCLGNHDVWAGTQKTDPLYGKKYATERLGLQKPYYSFDRAGWHFIILDSTHPVGDGWYTAKLDEAQWEWLQKDLANTPKEMPVLVLSHIPILTATGFYPENLQEGSWKVPGSWMHTDFQPIQQLFMQHGNVKLCLSGHMHLIDQVVYNGISYLCNGAVSGNWWGKPLYHESQAGYATIDLFADGTFSRQFHHFDWENIE